MLDSLHMQFLCQVRIQRAVWGCHGCARHLQELHTYSALRPAQVCGALWEFYSWSQ